MDWGESFASEKGGRTIEEQKVNKKGVRLTRDIRRGKRDGIGRIRNSESE